MLDLSRELTRTIDVLLFRHIMARKKTEEAMLRTLRGDDIDE
jgi:hypothetical protein